MQTRRNLIFLLRDRIIPVEWRGVWKIENEREFRRYSFRITAEKCRTAIDACEEKLVRTGGNWRERLVCLREHFRKSVLAEDHGRPTATIVNTNLRKDALYVLWPTEGIICAAVQCDYDIQAPGFDEVRPERNIFDVGGTVY